MAGSHQGNLKKVRVVSPHLSRTATEHDSEDEDSYHAALSRAEHRSNYTRSQYSYQSPLESENQDPDISDDDFDSEDGFDGDEFRLHRKVRRLVPYKANQTLNVDWDNPWRNSTAMGNFPGAGKQGERDATVIPPKAQRTLGMSRTGRALNQEAYRRENSLSPETDNVAPKALRTLGIPSNPFQRSSTADNASIRGDEEEPLSLASAAHRHMDKEEFKRLLLSGHRGPALDNCSSTDVSSNSRSSMLSAQSYRETPRSSHEILPEDFNVRSYSRFANRTPMSIISSKSGRTDSLVDPNAVLTEPFSPLSSINPDSPTDLNKPLPQPPKRPETIYELPGGIPVSHYGSSSAGFVAELPASPPIAELADTSTANIVELPSNEVIGSTVSATSSRRTGAHAQRSGLSRAATSEYPSIAELDSPTVAELPSRYSRQAPLHHAKTLPSMHSVSQDQLQIVPAAGGPSISQQSDRGYIGSLPPRSPPRQQINAGQLPTLKTNLPKHSQAPPRYLSITNTVDQAPPSYQSHQFQGKQGNVLQVHEKEPTAPETHAPNSNPPVFDRPLTPVGAIVRPETPDSPSSPSSVRSAGLGMIANAALLSAHRKRSAISLRNPILQNDFSEARRKLSSASLGAMGNNSELAADISSLQKDVESLKDKISLSHSMSASASKTGHGTPPDAVETGKIGQSLEKVNGDGDRRGAREILEMSEIQRAVQSAADEAAKTAKEDSRRASDNSSEVSHSVTDHSSASSSTDDITPKASDVEEAGTARQDLIQ